jgi:phage gpG-like protein
LETHGESNQVEKEKIMEIEFELEGVDEIIDVWNVYEKWLEKTLPHINPIIETSIFMNYMSEGRPKWKKRQQEYAWPILWKTGAKRALELASARAPFYKSGDGEYTLNIISMYYGKYHQYGIGQVVRKSTTISKQEREQIQQAIIKYWLYYYLNR